LNGTHACDPHDLLIFLQFMLFEHFERIDSFVQTVKKQPGCALIEEYEHVVGFWYAYHIELLVRQR